MTDATQINLTPIIDAFIVVLAAIAIRYIVPWFRGKTTAQQREDFLEWVRIAVAAAEQLFDSTAGREKLKYVMDFLQGKGYSIDTEETRNAIEAAVISLHNALKAG